MYNRDWKKVERYIERLGESRTVHRESGLGLFGSSAPPLSEAGLAELTSSLSLDCRFFFLLSTICFTTSFLSHPFSCLYSYAVLHFHFTTGFIAILITSLSCPRITISVPSLLIGTTSLLGFLVSHLITRLYLVPSLCP